MAYLALALMFVSGMAATVYLAVNGNTYLACFALIITGFLSLTHKSDDKPKAEESKPDQLPDLSKVVKAETKVH